MSNHKWNLTSFILAFRKLYAALKYLRIGNIAKFYTFSWLRYLFKYCTGMNINKTYISTQLCGEMNKCYDE